MCSGAVGRAGGEVALKRLPGRQRYDASLANGVQSHALSRWSASFSLDGRCRRGERSPVPLEDARRDALMMPPPSPRARGPETAGADSKLWRDNQAGQKSCQEDVCPKSWK